MVAVAFNTGELNIFDSSFGFLFRSVSSRSWSATDSGGSGELWGTFTVGETINLVNTNRRNETVDNLNVKFEGTFTRTGTGTVAERTYLVFSYEDGTYGTRYALMGAQTSDADLDKLKEEFDGESDIVKENYFIPCFLSGTLIATPAGNRKVEELAIGDLVFATGGGGGGIFPYP